MQITRLMQMLHRYSLEITHERLKYYEKLKAMSLTLIRPSALADGILNITNGEESRVEFSGNLKNGNTYATLTYITAKNSNKERDLFTIRIDSKDLDSNKNFIHQLNLAWNSSNTYQLARIQTNLGEWKLGSNEKATNKFISDTKIDPSDKSLLGFELINNREDRTYPIAAISLEGINSGVFNVDKRRDDLKIKGFFARISQRRQSRIRSSANVYILERKKW